MHRGPVRSCARWESGPKLPHENRRTEPNALSKQLRGDLDAITLQALEKDRARRYGSASELAADVGRFLRNEPVGARPSSVGYRARKYTRRHGIALAVATSFVLLLCAFAATEAVQLRRITRERDRADRITSFMTDMFTVSNPSEARGRTITVREVLDKASKEIDAGLARDPQLQAYMMFVMGRVYSNLALYSRGQDLAAKALRIQRRTLGLENPETLKSAALLASAMSSLGHYTEAERLDRDTLAIESRVLGPEHIDTLKNTNNLAIVLGRAGRYPEAEVLERETVARARRVLGSENEVTLSFMNNLAIILRHQREYAESEELLRETLQVERRVLGLEDPTTLKTMNNLSGSLIHQGKFTEAERVLRENLDIKRRILGQEHEDTLSAMTNLAIVLFHQARYDQAESLLTEAVTTEDRILGPNHPATARDTYYLACVAAYQGQDDRAFALVRQAIDHGLNRRMLLEKQDSDFDLDLKPLQTDPRFAALTRKLASVAAQ